MAKVLTQRAVDAAKPKAKRYDKRDGLVPGLRLIVHPSGAKSYALYARVNGEQIKLTIRAVLTLAQAREEARRLLTMTARGEDPRAVKQEALKSAAETFEVVAKRFIERHCKVHNRSWRKTEQLFAREVLPRWRHRPIDSIKRPDMIALLDSVVDRGKGAMANALLAATRRMFHWCIERGTLETSPCDRVRAPAPLVRRDRVHSDDELRLIWRAADTLGYPFGPFIKLLILTGQRRDEVGGMRWSELNPELVLWELPATRVKNSTLHRVPISAAVRAILAELPRIAGTDFVFTLNGKTPISSFSKLKSRLDALLPADMPPWVLHDLRRTMASGMARLGVALPTVEKILNHISGSFGGVAGIYQRHDFAAEKQEALERWAQHVLALASSLDAAVKKLEPDAPAARVVPRAAE